MLDTWRIRSDKYLIRNFDINVPVSINQLKSGLISCKLERQSEPIIKMDSFTLTVAKKIYAVVKLPLKIICEGSICFLEYFYRRFRTCQRKISCEVAVDAFSSHCRFHFERRDQVNPDFSILPIDRQRRGAIERRRRGDSRRKKLRLI